MIVILNDCLKWKTCLWASLLLLIMGSCAQPEKAEEVGFSWEPIRIQYSADLDSSIYYLSLLKDNEDKWGSYKQSRKFFKSAEPVMAYADVNNYATLNGPNILKVVEEDLTDIKMFEPFGFQVIEETLGEDEVDTLQLNEVVDKTISRLSLIRANVFFGRNVDYHFLWMLRKAIARVVLTGVTGFDSPVLEASLEEARFVYTRLSYYLAQYEDVFTDKGLYAAWQSEIELTKTILTGDFNDFDRFSFTKNRINHQLGLWNRTVNDWGVEFPLEMALNNDITSFFDEQTFNMDFFADRTDGEFRLEKVALGKSLFNDKSLSKDGKMSCTTCHASDKAFTDGKKVSFEGGRNSPTLTYAALQKAFFHEGRSGSLEGQIINVVNNHAEFQTDLATIDSVVKINETYVAAFDSLYKDGVNETNIRHAIAEYVRSLSPFSSKFDVNISGKSETLTEQEIAGYNLFSGKAKCATCHFAPVFNGTIPPNFLDTELEHLGVPERPDTMNAVIDDDKGRFHLFNTPNRTSFFKTPTIRNIALTTPYMHNGVYETLEQVMDFYNRGGGEGIGISSEFQTLPPDPLNLTTAEQQAIIVFMKTLTDELYD